MRAPLDGVVNRSDRNASVGVNTSVDSIREFNVLTSTYSAEYGRAAGAPINVVSKSGANQLHGTLFEYLRNNVFDANNFFTAPGERKSLRRNQFGGTLGGPLRKDRAFYFASYQRRARVPVRPEAGVLSRECTQINANKKREWG